ncbi:MAG: YihY/virulence factor BrkB family protein [Aphanocapsa feldmannii 277cV]|uniref:YihY/virulence factor BrkB family protein n=2 Tax=Aphanocapsa feldmannii TaxID=192050 RepID=A0A524RR63_9CHRO|nr:MAG: YihY/virulence factor BrkB family protein [Aphanocapsa feldmannii 288cV]TGG96818.1 MAG: YihY/virulence factor BrkB family protein [Aphanocapsa feldmannii 277cV]TGH18171.1 MAG: YihY/virulence factor BrkB family protein [Aphanocapsa feldmannii 277cI]
MQRWVYWKWCVRCFIDAGLLWNRETCIDLSAAFAYHMLQSFFPLLLVALAAGGLVFGPDREITSLLLDWVAAVVPASVFPVVRSTLEQLNAQGTGAGILGLGILLVTASNAYLSLQRGSDRLWGFHHLAHKQSQPPIGVLLTLASRRLEGILVVVLLGISLIADNAFLLLRSVQSMLIDVLNSISLVPIPLPSLLLPQVVVRLATSLLVLFGASTVFLMVVPSRRVPFRPLLPGAVLITLGLALLDQLVERSVLSLGSQFQAYGIIGSVMVLALWSWLVGLVLYYGVALSVCFAGSRLFRALDGG